MDNRERLQGTVTCDGPCALGPNALVMKSYVGSVSKCLTFSSIDNLRLASYDELQGQVHREPGYRQAESCRLNVSALSKVPHNRKNSLIPCNVLDDQSVTRYSRGPSSD